MRSFYQIHAMLKSHDMTEPGDLAHQCIRAAATVPQVLQQTINHLVTNAPANNESLKAVLTACSRATHTLITAFTRFSHIAGGAELQGHVTYAYVQMYRKLHDLFAQVAAKELAKSSSGEIFMSLDKKKQSPSKVKPKPPKLLNIRDNANLNLFTKLLCGVVDMLQAKTDAHTSLFEGFAYVVLEVLGSRLYTVSFGHARGSTIGEEIKAGNTVLEMESSTYDSSLNPNKTQVGLAKLEAPYLVHLLTHIMNAAPAHLGAIVSSNIGKAKQANNKGSMKGALAIAAKERLQRTLVNCMFGAEEEDENDLFKDCLRMPTFDKSILPMPKVKQAEVQEWFKEEVWVRLGWEILARESDW